jgi:hypothetical protein
MGSLKRKVNSIVLGIGTQVGFVALVVGLTAAIHHGIFDSAMAMVRSAG